jgi:hypothetical protein
VAVEDARSVSSLRPAVAGGLDLVALEVGRVIEARVVSLASGMAVLASRQGSLEADLSSLGAKGAAVGDVLRLEVRSVETGDGSSKLTLALADRPNAATTAAAAAASEGPTQVLARAARAAATGQSGLAPLFASLAGLAGAPVDSLPEPVRRLATLLMQNRLGATAAPTAADVKRAFTGSGLFTESQSTAPQADPASDLKVGLAVLRVALRSWLGAAAGATAPAAATVAAPTAGGASAAAPGDRGATTGTATGAATSTGDGDGSRSESTSPFAAGARVATAAYGVVRPSRGALPPDAGLAPRQATAVYGGSQPAATVRPAIEPAAPTVTPPAADAATAAGTAGRGAAVAGGVGPAGGTVAPTTVESGEATAATATVASPAPAAPRTLAAVGDPSAVPADDAGSGPSPATAAVDRGAVSGDRTATIADAASVPDEATLRQMVEDAITATLVDDGVDSTRTAAFVEGRMAEAGAAAAGAGAADRLLRPPPPRRGQPTRGQAALPVDGADGSGGVEALGRRALERTDGALKRILLEQAAVLDRSVDETVGGATAEWTAELPLATRTGTSVVQMTVERDGGRRGSERGATGTAWRVRFSLDVEPLGPVHARVGLAGERLSIGLWVERPEAAARLAEEIGGLRGALEAAAIPVEGLHVAVGRPAVAKASSDGRHFIDVSL